MNTGFVYDIGDVVIRKVARPERDRDLGLHFPLIEEYYIITERYTEEILGDINYDGDYCKLDIVNLYDMVKIDDPSKIFNRVQENYLIIDNS